MYYHLRIASTEKDRKIEDTNVSTPCDFSRKCTYQAYKQLWLAQVRTSLHRLPQDLQLGSEVELKCLNGDDWS